MADARTTQTRLIYENTRNNNCNDRSKRKVSANCNTMIQHIHIPLIILPIVVLLMFYSLGLRQLFVRKTNDVGDQMAQAFGTIIVLLLLGFFTLVVPIYHFEYEVQPDIVVKVGSRWIHSIDKEVLVSVDKKRVMMVEDYPLISFGDPKPTSRYQLK